MITIDTDIDKRVPRVEEKKQKVDYEMARYVDWSKARADARRERLQTVGIGIILLIFVIIAIGCAAIAKKTAAATDVAQVEEGAPLDGSTAGANAVTIEDITSGSRHGGEIEWPVGRQADNGVTFIDAQDGPFPVLPIGWQSFEIYDMNNWAYTVIYDTRGGAMAIVPTLDADGNQKKVPFG